MSEVTRLLDAAEQGDPRAAEELLPLVYDDLRRLAAAKLRCEPAGDTLQPTALVHEAWLRIAREHHDWHSRRQFFTVAAEAMRRILTDRARRRQRLKHGAGQEPLDLAGMDIATETDDERLLQVHEALDELAREDPVKAELVKLRFFVGLRIPDAAEILGLSPTTAKRHWNYARAWLYDALKNPP